MIQMLHQKRMKLLFQPYIFLELRLLNIEIKYYPALTTVPVPSNPGDTGTTFPAG